MSRLRVAELAMAAGLLAAGVGPGISRTSSAAALAPTALLPPQIQALEQKMERLKIDSERFSQVSQGFALGSPHEARSGEPEHLIRTSLSATTLGEACVSPAEGEVFLGAGHKPAMIAIGSTLYRREREGKRSHGRPWVRSTNSFESPATQILPFAGGDRSEVDAGGKGGFAGLINLLATAIGPVNVDGPASVQGQQTTELTATVEPRLLIKHLTVEDVEKFKTDEPIEQLQMFVTEAGLPIRVVANTKTADLSETLTTEILAVNIPLSTIEPPPASQTIAASTLRKREQQREAREVRKKGK